MKPIRLNRRTLLRGAGGLAIALPWLEAMSDNTAQAQDDSSARRFFAVYQPGGTILDEWTPTGTETAYALSPILAPFDPVKEHLLVPSGLSMKSAVGEQSQSGLIAFLTGTPQGASGRYAQGPSLDQVLAPRLSAGQPHPSLHLAVRWGTGKAQGQVSPIDILAYADDAEFSPIAPQIDPQEVWQSLFGALPPPTEDGSLARDQSVLDYLEGRYRSMSLRLGAADRQRLDQHAELIRELELVLVGTSAAGRCIPPEVVDTSNYDPHAGLQTSEDLYIKLLETDAEIPRVGKWMMDMLVTAMACDLTSVATLQWADTEGAYTFPWLDLLETHYYYQNGGGFRPAEIAQICTWYSTQHAYLLERMASVDMGGHTLLDEAVLFFGSEVQHPATHIKSNMPFLLAGHGGGLRPDRWLAFDDRSHNDLLVGILNLFGDERTSFGFAEYNEGPRIDLT